MRTLFLLASFALLVAQVFLVYAGAKALMALARWLGDDFEKDSWLPW